MTGGILFVRVMVAGRAAIVAESLAMRHQLGILLRRVKRRALWLCNSPV